MYDDWENWKESLIAKVREHVVPDYAKEFQDEVTILWSNLAEVLSDCLENMKPVDIDENEMTLLCRLCGVSYSVGNWPKEWLPTDGRCRCCVEAKRGE